MHIHAEDAIAIQVRTVLLNGMDVTTLTAEVDTDEGWVNMLVMGPDGRIITDSHGLPLTLQVHGRVVVGMRRIFACDFCHAVFDAPGAWAAHIKNHPFGSS